MKQQKPVQISSTRDLTFFTGLFKQLRLVWLLLRDGQVPFWIKSVPALSLIYVISPLDFIPDAFLGLGQLDDLGIILLGITLFLKLCPPNLVQYYQNRLEYGPDDDDNEAVDTTYNVIDEKRDK
jgi:uncharacterized membrane protein YkvA (DUF1232 family)